jgi:hypothetical protein
MLGHAREIEKGMLFTSDWNGPWYRANKVKKGKLMAIITVDGGQRVSFDNQTAVRFVKPGVDPQPASLRGDYERPTPRKKEV